MKITKTQAILTLGLFGALGVVFAKHKEILAWIELSPIYEMAMKTLGLGGKDENSRDN